MQLYKNKGQYAYSDRDKEILKGSRVAGWLQDLDKEFALHHTDPKTQKSYRRVIIRFILWKINNRCMLPLDAAVRNYLTMRTEKDHIAASTQNVDFNALLFFCRNVLKVEIGRIDAARAKKPERLYVILSRGEVRGILDHSYGVYKIINGLMYGDGLRVEVDCLEIRIKDVHLDTGKLDIRESKHGNARVLDIPKTLIEPLRLQIEYAKRLHDADLAEGWGEIELPGALAKKYPNAGKEFGWQYLFPASSRWVAEDGRQGRCHLHVTAVQEAFRTARKAAGVIQPATPHCLRHCYATHSLEDGMDIRDLQKKLGHRSLEPTMVYTQYTQTVGMRSPLDRMYDAATNALPVNIGDDIRRWLIAFAAKLGISPGEAAGQIISNAAQGGL